MCHIKNYVQIYRGNLYKCPVRATVGDTLERYNLTTDSDWSQYYTDYVSVGPADAETDINDWFERQKLPEKTCNQCGFYLRDHNAGARLPTQGHLPKVNFKIKPLEKTD